MKILILGMPYFAKRLQNQLSKFDESNIYINLDTYYNKLDKLKYLWHILNTDIIYMHGGGICCSGTLNLALKLNKKIFINWAGSDVLKAQEIKNNKMEEKRYIENITHLCETSWIQNELLALGISATLSPVMIYDKQIVKNLNLPKVFTVLSYVSKDRPEFYGIDTLIKLANDFPLINFRIAGIKDYTKIPNNIKLLGWVDMKKEYLNSIVYIRTPKHDGLAYSVLEALSYGRMVFRNYDFNFVNYFKDYNDLKLQLSKVIDDFNNGKLTINQDAIDFVQTEFSKEKVLGNLVKVFENDKK
jgi:glycosyltransferase involved in cell wall biosynthesis